MLYYSIICTATFHPYPPKKLFLASKIFLCGGGGRGEGSFLTYGNSRHTVKHFVRRHIVVYCSLKVTTDIPLLNCKGKLFFFSLSDVETLKADLKSWFNLDRFRMKKAMIIFTFM